MIMGKKTVKNKRKKNNALIIQNSIFLGIIPRRELLLNNMCFFVF